MENNESQKSERQQAYNEGYSKGFQDGLQAIENANEKLTELQNERIKDLQARIDSQQDIIDYLRKLVDSKQSIIQIHLGSGDNVGRDENNNSL
ncbi:MAG: hypothetical protein AB4062_18640 [Crocosphaera sp.]